MNCTHLDQITPNVQPNSQVCEDCVREGTKTVQLRMCLTCGNVGCCDSSSGTHARKHHEATGHPIIESFKSAAPGTTEWRWCYVDNAYL